MHSHGYPADLLSLPLDLSARDCYSTGYTWLIYLLAELILLSVSPRYSHPEPHNFSSTRNFHYTYHSWRLRFPETLWLGCLHRSFVALFFFAFPLNSPAPRDERAQISGLRGSGHRSGVFFFIFFIRFIYSASRFYMQ